jgi:FtsH-binding integral membrane protein
MKFPNNPYMSRVLGGLFFLFSAFLQYLLALRYAHQAPAFLGNAGGVLLACLLPLLFMLGWWFAGLLESLALTKGQRPVFIAVCILIGLVLVAAFLGPGTLLSPDRSFWKGVRSAGISILLSGLSFRLSLLRPEAQAILNRTK